eukprot:481034-Lingulodinium_polyedra.AAC.1
MVSGRLVDGQCVVSAWSLDGYWMVVGWPAGGRWVAVRINQRVRTTMVSRIHAPMNRCAIHARINAGINACIFS